jgi:tetratricopeptide (TPR) repeat protein
MGLLLALSGCSTLIEPRAGGSPRIVRPEAPAEYDYLVGRDLELDGRLEEAFEAYARAHDKDPGSAFLLRKLAETAARSTRLQEALDYGEQALRLQPDDADLRLFLGSLYRFRKHPQGAERVLRDASGDPVSLDAGLMLYNIYNENGQLAQSRAIADWMVSNHPESLQAVLTLAHAHQRAGDPDAAEAVLRDAMERGLDALALSHRIAALRRERGDREGEIALYRELRRDYPSDRETLARLAEALDSQERSEEAREILEILESEHGDLLAMVRLGYLHLREGRYPEAAELFERVLAADPRQHEVAYLLGVVRRRLDQEDEAIAAFRRIPSSHNRYVDARTQIAGILEERGDFAGALEQVELAREHQTARPLDLYTASLRAKTGDFAGAVAFLESLLEESPDDPEVFYNLGVIHGETQRQQEAIGYMQRVLELNPDHAGALNYIGYSWAEQGMRLDEAEALIVRALEIRPDDGYITDSLGWVYYMRARPLMERGHSSEGRALLERSIAELEKAAELTGGDPVISEHLGDAYLLLEDKQRALELYEEALQLGPREQEQPELRGKTESLRRELGVQ